MAKQKKPTGGEKLEKLSAKDVDTKIDDTGKAVVTPWDPKTGPAAGDKIPSKDTPPKSKPSDAEPKGATKVKDLENIKSRSNGTVLEKAFKYFEKANIALSNLVIELKEDLI